MTFFIREGALVMLKKLAHFFPLLFLSIPAAQTDTLNIGILNLPPAYICGEGKPAGYYTELLEEVATRAGFKHNTQCLPTKRLYMSLANGEIDLFMGLNENQKYKDRIIASENPIKKILLGLYALSKSTLPNSREDWLGKRFVVINGYEYSGLIADLEKLEKNGKISIHRASNHKNAMKMLYSHRADLLLDYELAIKGTTDAYDSPELFRQKISDSGLHFLVSRKTPHAESILERLVAAHQELQ